MALSPLFDIYDPTGEIRQRSSFGWGDDEDIDPIGVAPLPNRRPLISDLMPPQEQKSLLGKLAGMGSSGLAGLGWILDTPGAMVRGLLSGGPVKALSALWDTTDERVDGRELLRQYGLAGKDDNWGNFGGGLGAEILLDPMTYASFGLLPAAKNATRVGKLAEKAGLAAHMDDLARAAKVGPREFARKQTAKTLLEGLPEGALRDQARERFTKLAGDNAWDEKLYRMNRLSFPGFTDGAADLFGEGVGDAMARFHDKLGKFAVTNPITGPLALHATAAFVPAVMGQTDYARQLEARELWSAKTMASRVKRAELAGIQYDAEQALNGLNIGGKPLSLNDPEVSRALRYELENNFTAVPDHLKPAFSTPGMRRLRQWFRDLRKEAPEVAAQMGIPLETIEPRGGGYWVPRQQTRFDVPENPSWPEGVVPYERDKSPQGRASRRVQLGDTAGSRRDYLDVMGQTATIDPMTMDANLHAVLRKTAPENVQDVIRKWLQDNRLDYQGKRIDDLYSWIDAQENGQYIHKVPGLSKDHPLLAQRADLQAQLDKAVAIGDDAQVAQLNPALGALSNQIESEARSAYRDQLYQKYGDMLRYIDPQHARTKTPLFGRNTFSEIANYAMQRADREAMGQGMMKILGQNATLRGADEVLGGVNIPARQALKELGYTDDAVAVLERQLNLGEMQSIDDVSFNKSFIDAWTKKMQRGQMPPELSPLMEKASDFTKTFKTLALAWPSRLTRDLYSGGFAGAMRGIFNPLDWYAGAQMRKGNYKPLTEGMLGGMISPRLAKGEYADLFRTDPQAALRKFLVDAGGEGMGTASFADDLLSGADSQLKEFFPGAAKPQWSDIGRRFYNKDRTWKRFAGDVLYPFAVRGSNGNRNPILELFDRAAETTDAANRYGSYLQGIRQGMAPEEASRLARLTQVDYRPEAFTDFERKFLKPIFPFYSYTRGIMPLIADEIANRPHGLMGKSIRTINRGGQPSEDNFVPEYLRQSASIPLPDNLKLFGVDTAKGLKRFLTNIDLPFESAINLITPGTGNTVMQKVGNTLTKSALNLLGQTNPLIKGPLESITNRQFYSGRQLSDLYSMLEQTMGAPGRAAEQFIVNMPGGSRALGLTRQLTDERLSPQEKWSKILVNALTGLKFQDVDVERTRRLAARDMLNELLSSTPGVRTYENLTVPADVLQRMPKEQQQMYLLYKIIQAEAAKRARAKKKAQAPSDPLDILGVQPPLMPSLR